MMTSLDAQIDKPAGACILRS